MSWVIGTLQRTIDVCQEQLTSALIYLDRLDEVVDTTPLL
jgi:hypothetical protein